MDFLRRLTLGLEQVGVPYMVAGSTASSFHGEPRTTHDVDIVVELAAPDVPRLKKVFPDDTWYFDESAALQAIRSRRQFNLIDMTSGWKADFIVRKARAFSLEEFRRRARVTVDGHEVWMASPEDVILTKLEWALASSSTRQLRDVVGVLRQVGPNLDRTYIERWVGALGLTEPWAAVQALEE